MMEPENEFYLKCIQVFHGKILFITGEDDWRGAEDKFLKAAQTKSAQCPEKDGTLYISTEPGVGHDVLLHQDSFDEVHKEIKRFLDVVYH